MDASDEILMRYLDGELPASDRAALEAALVRDPALAARLAEHRVLAAQVRAAFDGAMSEPPPERLLRAVAGAGASNPSKAEPSNVVRFPAQPKRPVAWWAGGAAAAASLVVGVFVGQTLAPQGVEAPIGPDLAAHGVLAHALASQLASTQGAAPVRIGISFRSQSGAICRTFQGRHVAGLACREGEGWRVRMAVPATAPANGGYATAASGVPPEVMALTEQTISGRPFDADAEARAKADGWR